MWMGKLEELLTGRSFDEILAEVRVVATRDGGERLVVAMTESLQRALALLGDEEVGEIADKWASPDQLYGTGGDPALLARALTGLRDLVRAGQARSEGLYCWVSV